MKQNQNIPQGYKNSPLGIIPQEWEVKRLGEICPIFKSGNGITSKNIYDNALYPVYGGNGLRGYTNKFTHQGDYVLIGRQGALCGNINFVTGSVFISEHAIAVQTDNNNMLKFLMYKLDFLQLNRLSESSAQPGLSVEKLLRYKLTLPPLPEQQKIAEILSCWEHAIEKQTHLTAKLETRKRGLMQQLLTGKKRLKGFEEKWEDVELGEILDYEQPTKYLVKSTLYNHSYSTPVLTAGKTFILGYTNEKFGVYEKNLPVIIFDDFTTDTKLVQFPFKAKSSAMKILTPKNNANITFVFAAMQQIRYSVGGHSRHWISKYAYLTIELPSIEEQTAIANILSTADKEIQKEQEKLAALKSQKKGLMQVLLTGKKRVKHI